MTSPAVPGGVAADELTEASAIFSAAWQATQERHARRELGFLDLPTDAALLTQSVEAAERVRERRIRDLVVLGIGGSALGTIALRSALRPPAWNALDDDARDGYPRLHVLDNVDPTTMSSLLARLDLRTTLFVAISKSGSTAETMAQYLIAREHIEAARLPLRDHLVFITDPARGALRAIAGAEGIPALDVPPNVGGRFSVLSPVGLFPAAAIGIDVRALLAGASDMIGRCASRDLRSNPAGVFATLQWLADHRHGRHIHVFMPYADALRDMADWFVQLWAESLGKRRADGSSTGPTPIASIGATDQHSQLQLFMEGPPDKTVTFLTVKDLKSDLPIPRSEVADLSYLGGHGLAELLAAEGQATARALAKYGRPSMTLAVERLDAAQVGGLMMLLEVATAYAGELYAVNAFDQPGVELGKQFTYGLLGRPGHEAARGEWESLGGSGDRYVL